MISYIPCQYPGTSSYISLRSHNKSHDLQKYITDNTDVDRLSITEVLFLMSIEQTKLKEHFPMIRDRAAIMADINASETLQSTFTSWSSERQELFLDMCSGVRGVKLLYDSIFKEIMNPEHTPDRLSSLLSELLKRAVKVLTVLPNDSERLGDEMTLVITDIVVKLEDGTIANVEVQKLGYAFTGERASCYSADLLLRQYKRVRQERQSAFSYRDLAPVYTIVLMETSPKEFHAFPDKYVHYINHTSDTGIDLNLLQNFIFVPIDIFLSRLHNEGITTKLDAWLTFLGCDEPEWIIKLISQYPEFEPYYRHLYDFCRNIEGVMNMFSKELQIMDRNTVKYMIDELQEQLDSANSQITTLSSSNTELSKKNNSLSKENTSLSSEITKLKKLLDENGIKY